MGDSWAVELMQSAQQNVLRQACPRPRAGILPLGVTLSCGPLPDIQHVDERITLEEVSRRRQPHLARELSTPTAGPTSL